MSTKNLLASITCGLIVLVAQPISMAAANPSLAGSWQFTLTPATPTPGISIPGLATFTADGSVVETDGSEVAPSPGPSATSAATFGTPGHGIWQLLPARTGFYVQYISIVVNPDGALNSYNTTTMTVSVISATTTTMLSGDYTTVRTDPNGNVIKTISGAVSGQLIPHPKFP
jgi:hypothetical protein